MAVLFPICIKKYGSIVKLYIPFIDMEARATDNTDAINKAQKLIHSAFILDEIDKEIFLEDTCSIEGISEILKKNQREEYQDAQIVFIDVNTTCNDLSDLTLQVSQILIDDIRSEGIDYTDVFVNTMEEILRRKRLLNVVKDWTGKTVDVNNGEYFGEIKSIKYKKDTPWNFAICLKTGISDSVMIYSSVLEEIELIPVAMNELGTFRLVNQAGMISISGTLWWKKGHIDVYLEYNQSMEIGKQKTFEILSEFNKKKYELDEFIRPNVAKELMHYEGIIYRLFDDYGEENPQKREQYILNQLINRMNLYFINVSRNKDVYMDYNFSNEAGNISVGVTINLDGESFEFELNSVDLFEEIEDD